MENVGGEQDLALQQH